MRKGDRNKFYKEDVVMAYVISDSCVSCGTDLSGRWQVCDR